MASVPKGCSPFCLSNVNSVYPIALVKCGIESNVELDEYI